MSQSSLMANPLVQTLFKMVIYSGVLVAIAHLIYLDAFQENVPIKYLENTFTEWSQVGCLVLMFLLFTTSLVIADSGKKLSILMAGASLVAIVREFNNFFNDQVFDGAWQSLALIVAVITAMLFYWSKSDFKNTFKGFVQSSSCGVMMAGFITTFVFSRLFGRSIFWQAVMEEQYFRSVKNAAEEGTELLGYGLMLIGAIEYFIYKLNQTKPA